MECIEAIRSALGDDGFASYCQGNAMKYLWRHRRKGGIEDLEKAKWYIDRMIETEGEKLTGVCPFAAIILWKRRLQDGRYCMLDNMAKAARRLMI